MANVDQAKDELERILNGEEYRLYRDQASSLLSVWWDKVENWLADLLERLFPSFEKSSTFAGPILTIIIVFLLVIVGISFFTGRNRQQKSRRQTPLHSIKEIDWSSQRHLAEVNKYEALENYALATRHLFLALLLYFHENDWLEAKIWKTNWEYHEELKKAKPQAADPFYHLAHFFDEVTYGERQVEQEEYKRFRTEVMGSLNASDGGENQFAEMDSE